VRADKCIKALEWINFFLGHHGYPRAPLTTESPQGGPSWFPVLWLRRADSSLHSISQDLGENAIDVEALGLRFQFDMSGNM
jgi:hypothetical protein